MAVRESETDVLIIGAGACGMLAATCAAAYGMRVRIIDKRPYKITAGHADGVHSRTMEILDTFGLGKTVYERSYPLTMNNFYSPDKDGNLKWDRSHSLGFQPASPFISRTLSQAIIQDILEDEYISKKSSIKVERGVIGEHLTVKKQGEYPVELTIRKAVSVDGSTAEQRAMNDSRLDDNAEVIAESQRAGGNREVIKAKYVVACKTATACEKLGLALINTNHLAGAHSWTRRQLNIEMVGDVTDIIWGVMDIHPITDFPTPRTSNMIVSKGTGLLWIPRERGLVRIYTVLGNAKTDEDGKMLRTSITPEQILEAANENCHPYKVSYKHCEWWAGYQIGQRMAKDNIDASGRIFLAGDAVHTHSPQAGQGLNVSMHDTFNLMWKLNLVLRGHANPEILQTYRDERLVEGQRLVNYDRLWAALASGRDPPPIPEGTMSMNEAWGTAPSSMPLIIQSLQVIYPPSIFTLNTPQTAKDIQPYVNKGELPLSIVIGMRMPSYRVRNHSDSWLTWLHETFVSDGRFRFVLFPGDVSQPDKMTRLERVCQNIESLDLEPLIDVVTVHRADPMQIRQIDLPRQCNPFNSDTGYEYTKVFYDADDLVDNTNREDIPIGSAYEKYGIDRDVGALVLLRPDTFVAHCGDLDDFEPVRKFFNGFIIRRGKEQAMKSQVVANGH